MDRPITPMSSGLVPGVLALGMLLQVAPSAYADDPNDYINPDRPGLADGSYVIGGGRFQIETGLEQEYRSDAGSREQDVFIATLLRLGLDRHWEVRVEGNTYTWMRTKDSQGVTRSDGASPTSLGVKYHFIDSAEALRPSVGAILRVFPPSGTGNFRTAHTTGDLRLVADWDFASEWSLNPNIGAAFGEDNAGRVYRAGLFAITLNYNPSKILNLFIDTGMQSPEQKFGKTSIIFDAGVAYIIGRNIQVDLSVGSGATGVTPPRPFVAAGISKRF